MSECEEAIMSSNPGLPGCDNSSNMCHLESIVPALPSSRTIDERDSAVRLSSGEISINKLDFASLKLCGRQNETKQLLDAVERLRDTTNHTRQLILISGASGSGKTKLAEQLQKPVERGNGGVFVSGKFDFQQQDEPYSAIGSACRDLCDKILENTADDINDSTNRQHKAQAPYYEIREILRNSFGIEVQAILPIIPQLCKLLGQDFVGNMSDSASGLKNYLDPANKNHFRLAFQRFLGSVGAVLPVLIFLDDIDWADSASIDLVDMALKDRDNHGLMIVASYRTANLKELVPNQRHESVVMPWTIFEKNCTSDPVLITRIKIANLAVSDISSMLISLLATHPTDKSAHVLAELVHRKTAGNAFFIEVFLNSLIEKKLLTYDTGLLKWTWNAEDVEAQTQVSENVVGIMVERMKQLTNSERWGLLLAACLGAKFSRKVLTLTMDSFWYSEEHTRFSNIKTIDTKSKQQERRDSISAEDWLSVCQEEGFIEPFAEDEFRWIHDKVRESAMTLASIDDTSLIKFKMGQLLIERLTSTELEENIFSVVNHVNGFHSNDCPIADEKLQLKIIELNLKAGQKSMVCSAFVAASKYVEHAIALAAPNANTWWTDHYSLMLQLHTLAVRAADRSDDFRSVEDHSKITIAHAKTIQDVLPVYHILIDATGSKVGAQQAVNVSLEILDKLGCRFPKRFHSMWIKIGLARLRSKTHKLGPAYVSNLGTTMTSNDKIEALAIVQRMTNWALLANSTLLPLSTFRAFHWTLRYGLHENAPHAMFTVGLTLGESFGDYQCGRKYALQALELSDDVSQSQINKARTHFFCYSFILPWTQTIRSCMRPLMNAHKLSFEHGDIIDSMWCIYVYLDMAINEGRKLHEIEAGLRKNVWKMKDLNQMKPYSFSQVVWQSVQNCMGMSENPLVLTGEAMEEASFIRDYQSAQNHQLQAIVQYRHLFLDSVFANHERAGKLALSSAGDTCKKQFPGSVKIMRYRFMCALSCFSMAARTNNRKYKKKARQLAKIIKHWVEQGNPNVVHCDQLLDAELSALNQKYQVARTQFYSAILTAEQHGFIHDQALVNERFANYWLTHMNNRHEGTFRVREAIRLYDEWGANAKVEQLYSIHSDLLSISVVRYSGHTPPGAHPSSLTM